MAKKARSTKKKSPAKRHKKKVQVNEPDTTYFLKLVVFLILGSQWLFIESAGNWQAPIPVGLILGLVFATHEHFQIDRKIEYAILLVSSFIAFWLPIGLVVQI